MPFWSAQQLAKAFQTSCSYAKHQAKIVRQESLAIDSQHEKKRKQAEVGWKMCVNSLFSVSDCISMRPIWSTACYMVVGNA